MTDNGYHSASEIERDVERSRARVSDTLRELRERMSPGQMVDEFLDYAKASGGADFARNLGRSVTDNPLPLLLIGTGIAWLMTSNGRPHAGPSVDQLASTGRDTVQRAGEWMSDTADGSSERMGDMSDRMGEMSDSVGNMSDRVGDMAQGARDSASATADRMRGVARDATSKVSDSAKGLADSAQEFASSAKFNAQNLGDQMQRTWNRLAEDQPLVLGAMGLALGALLGAGLPSTRTEDRLMGDASDSLKGEVKKEAAHQYEKAKDVATEASKTVQDEMERKGFGTTETAGQSGSRDQTSTSSATSQAGGSGPERMGFQREPGTRGEGQF